MEKKNRNYSNFKFTRRRRFLFVGKNIFQIFRKSCWEKIMLICDLLAAGFLSELEIWRGNIFRSSNSSLFEYL